MTGQTTWNKATVEAGTDPWNFVPDNKKAIESAGLVFGVASDTERSGLAALAPGGVLPVPTTIVRTDVTGYPMETWDGTTWNRRPVITSGTATTDGFWTITGGLIKTVTAGLTQVTASLQMVRLTSGITVTTAGNALIVGMIPAGFRPPGNFSLVGSVVTNADARYAEPELIVNNGGSIVGRSVSGGDITIGVGYKLYISGTWYL
jgi:hypothetical protein